MTRSKTALLLATAVLLASRGSTAQAGVSPFTVEAFAQASGRNNDGTEYSDSDTAPNVALAPATAEGSAPDVSSSASATFMQFEAFSLNNAGGFTSTSQGSARANDTLTIQAAGTPAGTTRLELTWQVDGALAGVGQANFSSNYNNNAAMGDQLPLGAGGQQFQTPGSVNEPVTLVYDDVPIGAPWNVSTSFIAFASSDIGEADFDGTATFISATLFVDDVATPAVITGLSGQVYAIPEPASAAVLALGGVVLTFRVRRRFAG